MPISWATIKQIKPSDTTVAGRAIDVDMNSLSDSLVKARLEAQAERRRDDGVPNHRKMVQRVVEAQ
jgi:hypothetical protein